MPIHRFPRSRQSALPYPATLDLSFIGRDTLDPRITFTRADATTCATYFNSAGVLQTAAANVPRLDYDPVTLASRGFLIEESRTNSLRNNTMQGAVAGTPGTAPTNWQQSAGAGGITVSVVATGVENGITYIDLRWSGTPTSTNFPTAFFDTTTGIAALQNQTWTVSSYIKLVGGSLSNVSSIQLGMWETGAAGGFLASGTGASITPTNANLATQRSAFTRTLTNASTAFVRPLVTFTATNGLAIDITLRIGLPQLERGASVSSVIPTTTTALTRAADAASIPVLAPWFNTTEGTIYFEGGLPLNYSSGFQTFYSFNDSTSNNNIQPAANSSADVLNVEMKVSGSVVTGFYPAYVSGTTKLAFAYRLNDVNYAKDGIIGTTDTTATVPNITQINLGANQNPGNFLNGHLRRISYYPVRLSNTDLQAITA